MNACIRSGQMSCYIGCYISCYIGCYILVIWRVSCYIGFYGKSGQSECEEAIQPASRLAGQPAHPGARRGPSPAPLKLDLDPPHPDTHSREDFEFVHVMVHVCFARCCHLATTPSEVRTSSNGKTSEGGRRP